MELNQEMLDEIKDELMVLVAETAFDYAKKKSDEIGTSGNILSGIVLVSLGAVMDELADTIIESNLGMNAKKCSFHLEAAKIVRSQAISMVRSRNDESN